MVIGLDICSLDYENLKDEDQISVFPTPTHTWCKASSTNICCILIKGRVPHSEPTCHVGQFWGL